MDCRFSNTKILSQCHAVCKLLTAKKLGVTLVKCLLSPLSRFVSHRNLLTHRRLSAMWRCDSKFSECDDMKGIFHHLSPDVSPLNVLDISMMTLAVKDERCFWCPYGVWKTAFRNVKGGRLACDWRPFAWRLTVFCRAEGVFVILGGAFLCHLSVLRVNVWMPSCCRLIFAHAKCQSLSGRNFRVDVHWQRLTDGMGICQTVYWWL